ncbi:MAG: potassium channel protein [Desulfarculaceae bacterium]|nr:potassium channel protein [Desulfarculaceae bacterium]MCF8047646.1 potassium channel protein [Desulfarculaceae bacterium]MCF8063717.1 potassium channel protein [Desulfarculaceae bacterium]MCF8097046.1 potassium channel protein [Desulfarculaceae bacterium]MCF8121585.1 potassium channel protein [Desulfarculaceae bacterium]
MIQRVIWGVVCSLGVILMGTLGYRWVEDYTWLESIYMTIITVTTVGFGEVRPLSSSGRIFTMVLMLSGVGTILYLLTTLTQLVVEGKLREIMGRRSLERAIRSLKDHYIVCGYGRIGALVTEMIRDAGRDVVVIDNSDEATRRLESEGIHYVLGSATEDESLFDAGVERAQGLIATVSSDADNVYIVLTAKDLRPDIFVIARATEPGSERKLKHAGADKVVSPYFIGARRIAQTVIRPSVADFIDLTFHSTTEQPLRMEELAVGAQAELAGVSLKDSGIRQTLDLIVLAVKKADGSMSFNPPADTVVEVGDTLIAMGPGSSMSKLAKILGN